MYLVVPRTFSKAGLARLDCQLSQTWSLIAFSITAALCCPVSISPWFISQICTAVQLLGFGVIYLSNGNSGVIYHSLLVLALQIYSVTHCTYFLKLYYQYKYIGQVSVLLDLLVLFSCIYYSLFIVNLWGSHRAGINLSLPCVLPGKRGS